jgi:hypothetical protein
MNTLAASWTTWTPPPPQLPTAFLKRIGVVIALTTFLAMTTPLFSGCKTDTAGRVLVTSVQAVDSAMQGWANYVALGKATPAQELAVFTAYEKYQSDESAAQFALLVTLDNHNDPLWTRARDALTAAQSDLLKLVNQFTTP